MMKLTRPDFKQIKELIGGMQEMDALLQDMFAQTQQLRDKAAAVCTLQMKEQASVLLRDFPVEELKSSRAGIRTGLLTEAGYQTLYDLYQADDARLHSIHGIGEKQAASIRMIIDEFLVQLAGRERIRLSADRSSEAMTKIICALARCRLSEMICRDAREISEKVHGFLTETIEKIRVRNRIHWFFSRSGTKEETLRSCQELLEFSESTDYRRADRFVHLYLEAVSIDEEKAFSDFEKNSASYYALLENITGGKLPEETVYGSIPAQLAARIRETETDLHAFRGELRGYQHFGVQYILHQKRVLLGDEMGLGKTIQAIAVMAHLYSKAPDGHFLVICPASVMINWCREIGRFSGIPSFLLHGAPLYERLEKWKESGGAAVTNYESLRHITDRVDTKMQLELLIIDEAHYIKNPEAQRTKLIRRLDDESERILMMTGTPLENRVDEMCELIGFVRPDLVPEIRAHAMMRHAAAFREMLSPVYLRRQAGQVLEELPELVEKEEWCAMTDADLAAYRKAVQDGNFMAMRRVSFLQDDLTGSSKAVRLRELCMQAEEDGKKVVVYSYFRETLKKVREILQDPDDDPAGDRSSGRVFRVEEINGSTPVLERQSVIDRFAGSSSGVILLCQVYAGGTGLNIQAASMVIFCEPQIKPSLERQAVARVYRMGQIRNVLVCHLLCADTADEAIRGILAEKEEEFKTYADESSMADAEAVLADKDWVRSVIREQRGRYLPAIV